MRHRPEHRETSKARGTENAGPAGPYARARHAPRRASRRANARSRGALSGALPGTRTRVHSACTYRRAPARSPARFCALPHRHASPRPATS